MDNAVGNEAVIQSECAKDDSLDPARVRRTAILAAMAARLVLLALLWAFENISMFLELIGSGYLILAGSRHLVKAMRSASDQTSKIGARLETLKAKMFGKVAASLVAHPLLAVVVKLVLTDLSLAIDNVLAVLALTRNYWLIAAGVAFSMLVLLLAMRAVRWLLEWEPWIEHGAYVLILVLGFELLGKHFYGPLPEVISLAVSAAVLIGTIGLARLLRWRRVI